jgi:acyl carrier protein
VRLCPKSVDESAISIHELGIGLVARNRGEAMDARAAPQVGFDSNKLRALIAKYVGIDAERVTDEAHFRNDFDLDSLDQLDLLILIEEEFPGAELSDEAVQQIKVVGDLIRYMEINCLLGELYAQPFHRASHV